MEDLFYLGVKAIIKSEEGKILMLKVSKEAAEARTGLYQIVKYDIPGGRVDVGDTIENTLQKEVLEETGFKVISSTYLTTVFSKIRLKSTAVGDAGLILAIYMVTIEEDKIKLNNESDSYEWVLPENASKMFGDKYPPEFCDFVAKL